MFWQAKIGHLNDTPYATFVSFVLPLFFSQSVVTGKMSLSRIRRATSTVSFVQMNKEDHERERTRWLSKLEEIEARLAESETLNSDMQQIRAELVGFLSSSRTLLRQTVCLEKLASCPARLSISAAERLDTDGRP